MKAEQVNFIRSGMVGILHECCPVYRYDLCGAPVVLNLLMERNRRLKRRSALMTWQVYLSGPS